MPLILSSGLAIGCIIIGVLMIVIGGWFFFTGLKDREWSTVILSVMILGVAGFAFYSAYHLFTW